jgi:hypothetical protein
MKHGFCTIEPFRGAKNSGLVLGLLKDGTSTSRMHKMAQQILPSSGTFVLGKAVSSRVTKNHFYCTGKHAVSSPIPPHLSACGSNQRQTPG